MPAGFESHDKPTTVFSKTNGRSGFGREQGSLLVRYQRAAASDLPIYPRYNLLKYISRKGVVLNNGSQDRNYLFPEVLIKGYGDFTDSATSIERSFAGPTVLFLQLTSL